MTTERVPTSRNEEDRVWTNGFERERAIQLFERMDYLWDDAKIAARSTSVIIRADKGDLQAVIYISAWECENLLPDELEDLITDYWDRL